MGFLNYHDNQPKSQDWDRLKLKNAIYITLCLLTLTIIMAIGYAFDYFNSHSLGLANPLTELLVISCVGTLFMGLYTLILFINIRFFRKAGK